MTKIIKFDRNSLKVFRAEMQNLLNKYGIGSNVEFVIGNMKFSDVEVDIKVYAKIVGRKTFNNLQFESRVASLGLQLKNAFGDELVDYNSKAYKMPFVYVKANGKKYKCDERTAKMLFQTTT